MDDKKTPKFQWNNSKVAPMEQETIEPMNSIKTETVLHRMIISIVYNREMNETNPESQKISKCTEIQIKLIRMMLFKQNDQYYQITRRSKKKTIEICQNHETKVFIFEPNHRNEEEKLNSEAKIRTGKSKKYEARSNANEVLNILTSSIQNKSIRFGFRDRGRQSFHKRFNFF
jgi:hypothetical protein